MNPQDDATSPAPASDEALSQLLERWSDGEPEALEELLPLVYDELRRLAQRHMRRERAAHTLQPTALVHEVYLKLAGQRRAEWKGRTQFFAVAARVMRRVLVDHARSRSYQKRGGNAQRVTLQNDAARAEAPAVDLIDLDTALDQLAEFDPRKARVVELRVFGGLTIDETATTLEVATGTVINDYAVARAWLYRQLGGEIG